MTEVATAATEDWTLEHYRTGDEAEVLALFANVFGHERSLAHWNWQFRDNPYGGPFVTLARSKKDGALVGIYSVTPIPFNLMGRLVPGSQSVDTAVHADYRNQRVFERTGRDCYARCAETGIEAIIGFPNPRSYPGLVRSLDWRRVAFPRQYRLRFYAAGRSARALGFATVAGVIDAVARTAARPGIALREATLRRQIGGRIEISTTADVPDDYDSLWSMVRSQEVLSIWKDAAYVRWRYDQNPDHEFRYVALRRGGELVAIAVTTDLHGTVTLCELLVRERDTAIARLLVNRIVHEAVERGASGVEFIGHDIGFFDEVFAAEDFDRRLLTANVFCARAFAETGLIAELLPHGPNWTMVFGDGDFV